MTFRVGQRVVCINDDPMIGMVWGRWHPIKGAIYTISACGLRGSYGDYESVRLMEQQDRWRYRADRFRPVKETDISIFTAMLAPKPKARVTARKEPANTTPS